MAYTGLRIDLEITEIVVSLGFSGSGGTKRATRVGRRMVERPVTVRNEGGLHLRVAAQIARLAQESGCTVLITGEHCGKANGCSVLELLMLSASQGTPLGLIVSGEGENEVAIQISDVFDGGGGI